MEPKFKVGDKVRVVDNPHPEHEYWSISVLELRSIGNIYHVENGFDCCGIYLYRMNDDAGFYWPEYLLELVDHPHT